MQNNFFFFRQLNGYRRSTDPVKISNEKSMDQWNRLSSRDIWFKINVQDTRTQSKLRTEAIVLLTNPPSLTLTSLSLFLYRPLDLGRLFSFLILYTVGRTPRTGDQPIPRPIPRHRTTQTQNRGTKTSMRRVGFEPTTPVFERVKAIHALDRAAAVTLT
jgi:hypothetical protein